MPILYSPDGRPFQTDNPAEITRLTIGHGYTESRPFVPGEHTVGEVLEHLEKHPEEADAVISAERSGQNRKGVVGE